MEPLLRLTWQESELLCRAFATEFGFDPMEVIQFGMGSVLADTPEMADLFLLTEPAILGFNVGELKQELRFRHLKVSGRKPDLQARLIAEMNRVRELVLPGKKNKTL